MFAVRRRSFLGLGGALCAFAGGNVFAVSAAPTSSSSLQPLGARYLRDYPDELDHCRRLQAHIDGADPALLRELVCSDFRHGDTLRLDGWLLSRTELRVAGAAWLNGLS